MTSLRYADWRNANQEQVSVLLILKQCYVYLSSLVFLAVVGHFVSVAVIAGL